MEGLLCPLRLTQLVSTALLVGEQRGKQGGALAVRESWELHVWAAVCPTCLVKERPGHLGDLVLSRGGCFHSPERGQWEMLPVKQGQNRVLDNSGPHLGG